MYKIMKKWDGKHTVVAMNFKTMSDANAHINNHIALGSWEKPQGENREYYIVHDDPITKNNS